MPYNLVPRADAVAEPVETTWLKRFDAACWTVDFPRPMMASAVTTGPHALRIDAVFYNRHDLAGVIWEAVDRWSHPSHAYDTARDFRRCRLTFRWRSGGIKPLDALHGPTLTIEGRDAAGDARAWYVRLWNYASGSPEDAQVTIDFASLDGGFVLPDEADRVWAGDIDRMFISVVPPDYDGSEGALAGATEGWAELSEIACDGSGSVLRRGDAAIAPHGLSMATGYDDLYNQTPERVVAAIAALGYRGDIVHYVGMSHYFRLERAGGELYVSLAGGALNAPCRAWHEGFAAAAARHGLGIIWSLSYELFDAHCWNDWKQRAADGSPALTGWEPPSTLLSPAHDGAMAYLQSVARAIVEIGTGAGLAAKFQVGEPWWWVMPEDSGGHRRICLYDDATTAALGPLSVAIDGIDGEKSAGQIAMLDAAGALLAASTQALCEAVRGDHPTLTTHLLVYLPTVLDRAAPEAKRANVPPAWSSPMFDILQVEDYDWVTAGRVGESARAVAAIEMRLGYPAERQHYFSGFVLRGEDAGQWARIDTAAEAARRRGVAATYIWALPQVARDGFTHFAAGQEEGGDMQGFDEVDFPIAIGREAEVVTEFAADVVETGSGHEQRVLHWADARMRYDVGAGLRSEADVVALVGFFRARRGPVRGFRFRDPFDHHGDDEAIGSGDGVATRFALVKRYGAGEEAQLRRITRPVAESVRVSVDGVERAGGWTLEDGGWIAFDDAPAPGAALSANFDFDVPVRFAEQRLGVSRATYLAGELASVPLVEVREC
jgi:uncharacterized protein (TIGR02217 family)